jgi:phospholipase D-like protein
MSLLGALFALFISGFWVYCLADVTLTPSSEFRRLPKAAWIAFVVVTFVIGAAIWLAVRRPAQPTPARRLPGPGGTDHPGRDGGQPGNERPRPTGESGAHAASRPDPGPGQAAPPRGPDDDPDFLRSLDRAIHGAGTGDDPAGG